VKGGLQSCDSEVPSDAKGTSDTEQHYEVQEFPSLFHFLYENIFEVAFFIETWYSSNFFNTSW